jgi:hypothetical protein
MADEIPPGTLMPFNGEFVCETTKWLLCDGMKRENINDKYINLIKLNIGTITDDNFYIPPNYDNMVLSNSADIIKYDGKTHVLYDGHVHIFSSDSDNSDSDNSIFYNGLPKPLLLMSKSYSKWLANCYKAQNISLVKWIIKY